MGGVELMRRFHRALVILCVGCLLIFLLLAATAHAADADRQVETLQTQLQVCRLQITNANAWAQEQLAAMADELRKAQKRVAELEKAK